MLQLALDINPMLMTTARSGIVTEGMGQIKHLNGLLIAWFVITHT